MGVQPGQAKIKDLRRLAGTIRKFAALKNDGFRLLFFEAGVNRQQFGFF